VIVTREGVTLDRAHLELALSGSIWRVVSVELAPPAAP